jgi:hypothetical protein
MIKKVFSKTNCHFDGIEFSSYSFLTIIRVSAIKAMYRNIVTLAPEGNITGENPTMNLEANPPRNMKRGNTFLGNALRSITETLSRKYKLTITTPIEYALIPGTPS